MQLFKVTVATATYIAFQVPKAICIGICKDSWWHISLCEAEMANGELVVEVCVCEWREREAFHEGFLHF